MRHLDIRNCIQRVDFLHCYHSVMNDIGDLNGGAPALKAAAGGALKHFAGGVGGVAKRPAVAARRRALAACRYTPKPASCGFHGRLSLFAAYSPLIRGLQSPWASLTLQVTAWRRASSLQTIFANYMQCITGTFLMHLVHCNL